ncbi:MAG: gamma-glutamyltransferase family protein [Planctomycetes bacterium]|nr:gamma-glutamyltransferase family protein [Planctomycetota bacterium]
MSGAGQPAPRAYAAAAGLALAFVAGCRGSAEIGREAEWDPPERGAVVSEHPLATEAGLATLARGGNAADAAVAVALALAVVHPQAGNLGGGGFALWVPHSGSPAAIDFREVAPAAARPGVYLDERGEFVPERTTRGPVSVAVPGSPAGLFELHRRFGRLPLESVAAPAVALAREGFPIDDWLARDLAAEGVFEEFNAAARELFFPRGAPLAAGERLVQPELARTLERLATEGPRAFYTGPVADAIVRALAAEPIPARERGGDLDTGFGGGWITHADLRGYTVRERAPLVGWFRGHEIVTMPPPSSGGVALLQTLGVLEGLPLDPERDRAIAARRFETERAPGGDDPGLSDRMLHWWIEALRAAFADRAEHLGDPDFVTVPVDELLAPSTIAARRVAIGEVARVDGSQRAAGREGGETTHLCVLDEGGNAVSLTTTLNTTFGSGILVRGGGFLLNDEMDDFAPAGGRPNVYGLVGGAANAVRPGKRPLSSMTPTVVRAGGHANVMVLGSPGGPRIITAVTQVLLRVLVLGEALERAVAAPRLHQQWSPAETLFEMEFDPGLVEALERRFGQPVRRVERRFGAVQAILLDGVGGQPVGVSDPRRGGSAGLTDG